MVLRGFNLFLFRFNTSYWEGKFNVVYCAYKLKNKCNNFFKKKFLSKIVLQKNIPNLSAIFVSENKIVKSTV
jgi:hypothetical protein